MSPLNGWFFACEKSHIKIPPSKSSPGGPWVSFPSSWVKPNGSSSWQPCKKPWRRLGGEIGGFYRKIPMKITGKSPWKSWKIPRKICDDLWMMTGFLALFLKKPTQNHRLPPTFVKKNIDRFPSIVLYTLGKTNDIEWYESWMLNSDDWVRWRYVYMNKWLAMILWFIF